MCLGLLGACAGDDDHSPGADARVNDDAGNVGADEPAQLAGITALHNQVRADVGVAPLTWDPALAQIAQDWADRCVDQSAPIGLVDHNDGRSDTYPAYVGENIFGASGPATPEAAVNLWESEKQFYDYNSNSCAANQACGHYTQIVWANSTKLGCGISSCAGLAYGNTIVCDYAPGGNISGQRPY